MASESEQAVGKKASPDPSLWIRARLTFRLESCLDDLCKPIVGMRSAIHQERRFTSRTRVARINSLKHPISQKEGPPLINAWPHPELRNHWQLETCSTFSVVVPCRLGVQQMSCEGTLHQGP